MDVNIGKGITLSVDFDKMPANAVDHIKYIGARNVLMDSHASITHESNPNNLAEAARAMAEKKLAALMAGEVRVQSTREGDPVRAEAVRIATDIIKTALRKKGKKVASVDPKAIREAALKLVDRDATILIKAKARVEETRTVDVDVSELV